GAGGKYVARPPMAFVQFVNGLDDLGKVYLVDLEALADGAKERDGQFAAQVLAEFRKAGKDVEAVRRVHVEQLVGEQFEAQLLEQLEDAAGAGRVEETHLARVDHIQSDTNGHRLAVSDLVVGKLFQ